MHNLSIIFGAPHQVIGLKISSIEIRSKGELAATLHPAWHDTWHLFRKNDDEHLELQHRVRAILDRNFTYEGRGIQMDTTSMFMDLSARFHPKTGSLDVTIANFSPEKANLILTDLEDATMKLNTEFLKP